jgi:hypothetical protein
MNGHESGTPMEVFSSGTSDLTALVMLEVDANKPFSTPATLPRSANCRSSRADRFRG